jgi:hypothetical protein
MFAAPRSRARPSTSSPSTSRSQRNEGAAEAEDRGAMFFFAAFVLGFHYVNFYRRKTYWKLALETWVMIVFITWVLYYTGKLDSPLLNLYLLVVITSALTLGKLATLLQMLLIVACYVFLGFPGEVAGDGDLILPHHCDRPGGAPVARRLRDHHAIGRHAPRADADQVSFRRQMI